MGTGVGLVEKFNTKLLESGKGLNKSQLLNNGKVQTNNIHRSNGTLNGNKSFSGKTALANGAKLKVLSGGLGILSLGNDFRMTAKTGNSGYAIRGVISSGVGLVPWAGTPAAYWISQQPVNMFKGSTILESNADLDLLLWEFDWHKESDGTLVIDGYNP